MAKMTVRDVHVDKLLGAVSVGYQPQEYVAERVFPTVPVDKESDLVWIMDRGQWFQDIAAKRAEMAPAKTVGITGATTSFSANEWALKAGIAQRTIDQADDPIKPLEDHTEWMTEGLLRAKENEFATNFFTTGVWGTDTTLAGADQWSDYGGSDPLDDIETERVRIHDAIGSFPNVGVMNLAVWSKLKYHPALIEGIRHTGRAAARLSDLAELTEITNWYVAGAIHTTSNEGATDTLAALFGKHVLLCYTPPRPGLRTMAAGYTFVRRPRRVRRWMDDELEGQIVELSEIYGFKALVTQAGSFIQNAVA